jgi:hypothetical protein
MGETFYITSLTRNVGSISAHNKMLNTFGLGFLSPLKSPPPILPKNGQIYVFK